MRVEVITQRYTKEAQRCAKVFVGVLGLFLFSFFCSWGVKLYWFRPGRLLVSRLVGWAAAEQSRSRFSVGGNADGTDLTETHGFFNFVENLWITTDVWPLRSHFELSAISNETI